MKIPNLGIKMPKLGIYRAFQMSSPNPSLADALFSTTQQRVLGLLFGQPDRSFYATELIGLAGVGSGGVQRELARLAQSGLVTVRSVGNQKHFQANPDAPVFSELCGIVRKTFGLAEPLRFVLAPLAGQIKCAFVFGSVAKRQDTASSDIDLMVISDSLSYADTYAALELASTQLGRTVNPTIYSTQELARRIQQGDAFVTRVLAQPKLWLIGTEDDIRI